MVLFVEREDCAFWLVEAVLVEMLLFCEGMTAATAPCSIKFCVLNGPDELIIETEFEL